MIMVGWRNWQTRRLEEPVGESSCRFKSDSDHCVRRRGKSETRSAVAERQSHCAGGWGAETLREAMLPIGPSSPLMGRHSERADTDRPAGVATGPHILF